MYLELSKLTATLTIVAENDERQVKVTVDPILHDRHLKSLAEEVVPESLISTIEPGTYVVEITPDSERFQIGGDWVQIDESNPPSGVEGLVVTTLLQHLRPLHTDMHKLLVAMDASDFQDQMREMLLNRISSIAKEDRLSEITLGKFRARSLCSHCAQLSDELSDDPHVIHVTGPFKCSHPLFLWHMALVDEFIPGILTGFEQEVLAELAAVSREEARTQLDRSNDLVQLGDLSEVQLDAAIAAYKERSKSEESAEPQPCENCGEVHGDLLEMLRSRSLDMSFTELLNSFFRSGIF